MILNTKERFAIFVEPQGQKAHRFLQIEDLLALTAVSHEMAVFYSCKKLFVILWPRMHQKPEIRPNWSDKLPPELSLSGIHNLFYFFGFLIYFLYFICMKQIYRQEVADYLNNKFGNDFTIAEPYPYWMEDVDKPYWKNMDYEEEAYYEQEMKREHNRPMREVEFKCWCDAVDEILQEEIDDEEKNIVGYIR